ncbi:unnamed protein product [Alopecurus aequalis]
MAEHDEPAAAANANGRSPPAKRSSDGRSPQRDAQPHKERSSKSRDRGRVEHEDRERSHRRRGTDGERHLDREGVRDRGERSRDRDRHHREPRERSERREHRDRSDDRGYRRSRDRDAGRGDRDRDGHRRHRSRSRSKSQSKRASGFDQGPSQAIPAAAPGVIPGPPPMGGMFPNLPNMLPNMFNLPNYGQPQPMTQQATRHARRVYVGGLSPSANEQTVAVFFNQVMAAIGGNTVGIGDAVVNVYINHDKKFAFVEMRSVEEASNAMALDGIVFDGAPVKVRRPTDYNPSLAAMLGPSTPSPNLNLAAVGLTPGMAGALEGPDRIFVGGLPYYFTEVQVRELLETFGPLRAFDIVKDKETGNSKGYAFCVYQDVSVTDIACAALNGIQLGERTLTVRRANQVSSESRPEQENILLQAQQEAQMKKLVYEIGGALPTKVVCLTHVISPDDLKDDEEYGDILDDMTMEARKYVLHSTTIAEPFIVRPHAKLAIGPNLQKTLIFFSLGFDLTDHMLICSFSFMCVCSD